MANKQLSIMGVMGLTVIGLGLSHTARAATQAELNALLNTSAQQRNQMMQQKSAASKQQLPRVPQFTVSGDDPSAPPTALPPIQRQQPVAPVSPAPTTRPQVTTPPPPPITGFGDDNGSDDGGFNIQY